MQLRDSRLLLSATDLVNFHECEHLSALDRAALDDEALKAERTKPDDQSELLFRKGREFEASYLEKLKRLHPGAGVVVEIADPFKDPTKAAVETLAAMCAGASIIYQATSIDGDLVRSLSLFRCDQSSRHLLQDSHTALLEELKGRIIEGWVFG